MHGTQNEDISCRPLCVHDYLSDVDKIMLQGIL